MNSTTTFEYTDSPFLGRHNTAVSKADLLEGDFELTQFKLAAPSDRTQEIREIIQDGKVAELKDYLSENKNVKLINDLDDHGFSLLHVSARWNRVEMTRILIDHGAEVDIRLKNSSTPLHVAARFNCPEVAEVLLSSGARPSLVDSLNNNALHHAVRRRNKEMVYMLVRDTDIDVNAKTQVGLTALHLVCINGDKEICQTLLRHGADITAKTAELSTPLQVAIFSCNTSLAEMLIKQASSQLLDVKEFLNEPDVDQDCALHLAAESRNVKSVELCLKYGANVNAQRSSLMTPLHIASMRGDLEIVKILCGKGADIHIKDNEKKTSLHRAAYENRTEVIEFLISLGAPLDSKANDNRTPFLEAVVAGSVESARLLLDSGADAFASTSEMKNCLHLAVDNGHLEMVQLLLENKKAKENLYKSDTFERVPLHNAAIYPDIKILELLLTKYSRACFQDQLQQTPLHLSAQSGRFAHIEALGRAMAGINERDDDGMTPIHLAAMKGNRKACQVLVRLGADVNARDNDRWSPLMWAARSGCEKTSQELIKKKAVLDHFNNSGNTPLHIASSHGNVRVMELLLSSGAKVCVQNNLGQTCLDVAVRSGAGDVALMMAQHRRWREILDCRSPNHNSPMKILIEHFPEAASLVMDHCIKRSSHIRTDPNYTESYDFHLLDPGPDDEADLNGNRFFGPKTMVKFNREDLLLHPLTQKLLDVKWASFGRYIYYFNLIAYLVFLITYTIFIVTEREAQDFNPRKSENGTEKVKASEIFTRATAFNGAVLFVALIFAAVHIAKEIFQLFVQRRRYFTDASNMTEWALYLSTLLFILPYLLRPEELDESLGSFKNPRNLWIAGIISIFLCYVNVILFLRRFQPFGIYVSMFLEVFKTVARVFVVFFIFIIAFAIVFFILFKEQESFSTLGLSIVKVSVMMVGEFEYDTAFISSIDASNDKTRNPLNPFPEIALIFMFAFLFLMAIILMNLLVGLAVGDIESVQRTATLQRMAMQVSFVAEVENKYPRFITRRIYKPSLEIKPNVYRGKFKRFHAWLKGQGRLFDESSSLTSSAAMTETTISDIQQQVSKTKKRVKTLIRTVELQNRLLATIARQMNLNVEMDDLNVGHWVKPQSTYDEKSEEEKDDTVYHLARL